MVVDAPVAELADGYDPAVALPAKPELLPLDSVERHDIPYGRLDAAVVVSMP